MITMLINKIFVGMRYYTALWIYRHNCFFISITGIIANQIELFFLCKEKSPVRTNIEANVHKLNQTFL